MAKKATIEKILPEKPTKARGRIGPTDGAEMKAMVEKGTSLCEVAAHFQRSEEAINRYLHPESAPVVNKGKRGGGAAREADPIGAIPPKLKNDFIGFMVQRVASEYKLKLKDESKGEEAVRGYLRIQDLQEQLAGEMEKLKSL